MRGNAVAAGSCLSVSRWYIQFGILNLHLNPRPPNLNARIQKLARAGLSACVCSAATLGFRCSRIEISLRGSSSRSDMVFVLVAMLMTFLGGICAAVAAKVGTLLRCSMQSSGVRGIDLT